MYLKKAKIMEKSEFYPLRTQYMGYGNCYITMHYSLRILTKCLSNISKKKWGGMLH